MFPINLLTPNNHKPKYFALHSTMFPINPVTFVTVFVPSFVFTFHYVSY